MEKKKVTKKTTSKTNKKTTKKVAKKVTSKDNKKKKKGFTLIELLAVIIILGILMIIAIPSVTKYISDSRKSAYVDTAKEIVSGTRNLVNEGKLGMYDTNTTYYIPASYIETENASKSPYGEFTQAYIGVIYNGTGYKYYWISVDDAGQGVDKIIASDKLDEDDIKSDLNATDIENTVKTTGIGNREKIKIYNPNTNSWTEYSVSANVSEIGDGSIDTSSPRYLYLTGDFINNSNNTIYVGSALPDGIKTFNSYQEAMADFGSEFCIKIKLENNIVTEGYIIFRYNNNVYELKGGNAYDYNTSVGRNAFGSNKCGADEWFWCHNDVLHFQMDFYEPISFIIYDSSSHQCRIDPPYSLGCSPYW